MNNNDSLVKDILEEMQNDETYMESKKYLKQLVIDWAFCMESDIYNNMQQTVIKNSKDIFKSEGITTVNNYFEWSYSEIMDLMREESQSSFDIEHNDIKRTFLTWAFTETLKKILNDISTKLREKIASGLGVELLNIKIKNIDSSEVVGLSTRFA